MGGKNAFGRGTPRPPPPPCNAGRVTQLTIRRRKRVKPSFYLVCDVLLACYQGFDTKKRRATMTVTGVWWVVCWPPGFQHKKSARRHLYPVRGELLDSRLSLWQDPSVRKSIARACLVGYVLWRHPGTYPSVIETTNFGIRVPLEGTRISTRV